MKLERSLIFSMALNCCAFLFSPALSYAFHVPEHRKITQQAILEFNLCMQRLLSDHFAKRVESGNAFEDYNLARKWIAYSHFYHPRKSLQDLRRYDSSIRIIEIEAWIEHTLKSDRADLNKIFTELGHAIHHLQDAASPTHAVPVMHSMSDGFEKMSLRDEELPELLLEPEVCKVERDRARGDSLLRNLEQTALKTLENVHSPLTLRKNGSVHTALWSLFWEESPGPLFGSYGALGNNFGTSMIRLKSGQSNLVYEIEREEYVRFRKAQLRLAIDATRRALHWVTAKEWGSL